MKANIPFPYSNLFLLIIYLRELLRVHKFYSPINILVYLIWVYKNIHIEYQYYVINKFHNILLELYYRNGMITIVSGTKQSTVTLMESEYTHENYGHLIYWCTIGKCMHALSLLINLSFNTYPPCDISRHFFVHGIYSTIYFSGSSVSAPDNIILYQLIKTIYMVFPHHEEKSAAET